jgi:hypothetical protein
MYFSQYWNDSRLAFGNKIKKKTLRVGGADNLKDIWRPDTYVENEENIGTHKVASSVKILPYGEVHMSQRYSKQ